jgi:hypothetical protein
VGARGFQKTALVLGIWCAVGLTSCQGLINPTSASTSIITVTPTLPSVVIEPTNPAGFVFPINLLNITLTCTATNNYLLEFDYLPVDINIDSVTDPANSATNLACAYRTAGHGVCSGMIDFGTLGVVSLEVCQGRNPLTRVCISQTIRPAQCPVLP